MQLGSMSMHLCQQMAIDFGMGHHLHFGRDSKRPCLSLLFVGVQYLLLPSAATNLRSPSELGSDFVDHERLNILLQSVIDDDADDFCHSYRLLPYQGDITKVLHHVHAGL